MAIDIGTKKRNLLNTEIILFKYNPRILNVSFYVRSSLIFWKSAYSLPQFLYKIVFPVIVQKQYLESKGWKLATNIHCSFFVFYVSIALNIFYILNTHLCFKMDKHPKTHLEVSWWTSLDLKPEVVSHSATFATLLIVYRLCKLLTEASNCDLHHQHQQMVFTSI